MGCVERPNERRPHVRVGNKWANLETPSTRMFIEPWMGMDMTPDKQIFGSVGVSLGFEFF